MDFEKVIDNNLFIRNYSVKDGNIVVNCGFAKFNWPYSVSNELAILRYMRTETKELVNSLYSSSLEPDSSLILAGLGIMSFSHLCFAIDSSSINSFVNGVVSGALGGLFLGKAQSMISWRRQVEEVSKRIKFINNEDLLNRRIADRMREFGFVDDNGELLFDSRATINDVYDMSREELSSLISGDISEETIHKLYKHID